MRKVLLPTFTNDLGYSEQPIISLVVALERIHCITCLRMFFRKIFLVMGYHQGVQKQNCLKCFFIRKRIGGFARKLQCIGRECRLPLVPNKNCPITGMSYNSNPVSPDLRRNVWIMFDGGCASDGSACCSIWLR